MTKLTDLLDARAKRRQEGWPDDWLNPDDFAIELALEAVARAAEDVGCSDCFSRPSPDYECSKASIRLRRALDALTTALDATALHKEGE